MEFCHRASAKNWSLFLPRIHPFAFQSVSYPLYSVYKLTGSCFFGQLNCPLIPHVFVQSLPCIIWALSPVPCGSHVDAICGMWLSPGRPLLSCASLNTDSVFAWSCLTTSCVFDMSSDQLICWPASICIERRLSNADSVYWIVAGRDVHFSPLVHTVQASLAAVFVILPFVVLTDYHDHEHMVMLVNDRWGWWRHILCCGCCQIHCYFWNFMINKMSTVVVWLSSLVIYNLWLLHYCNVRQRIAWKSEIRKGSTGEDLRQWKNLVLKFLIVTCLLLCEIIADLSILHWQSPRIWDLKATWRSHPSIQRSMGSWTDSRTTPAVIYCRRSLHLEFLTTSCPQFSHRDYLSLY